ncbi:MULTISPECIES: acyltransferase [Saccharibacillus]|uniref:acyltransferase n=1 Tax=Saccharibacillus TaxID=456492 RepID=UPI00123890E4|nr:acyltransferase [Saccharibacillus sp. WB 17]MWJ33256.1 N-acetyltransferase [Saccharibacillus sp. WB 17]
MSNYFKHEKAIVESDQIGEKTRIWAFSHILPGAVIGEDCNINDHTFIENDVRLGDRVTVKSGVYIWDGITIEDDVFIGPNVTFTNDIRPRSKQYPDQFLKTVLKKGVSIGANATIVGGVTLNDYCMIGAGAVVTKDIPKNTLWYGNPAVFKNYICNCGEKLNDEFVCVSCQTKYKILNGEIVQL